MLLRKLESCALWRRPLAPQLPRRGEKPDTFAGLLGHLSKGTEKGCIVRAPNWSHWNNVSTPETWETISLSLGREPMDMLEEYGPIALLHSSGRRHDEMPEYAAYLDRAHQVLDAAGWASMNNSDPGKRWIAMKWPTTIGTVAVLARHWEWDSPKEFLALASRAPSATRAKLIEKLVHRWPTIDRDLRDASTNGLARAKLDERGWIVPLTLAWAAANGRLTGDDAPLSVLGGVMKTFGSR